jgi:hypothetical protein
MPVGCMIQGSHASGLFGFSPYQAETRGPSSHLSFLTSHRAPHTSHLTPRASRLTSSPPRLPSLQLGSRAGTPAAAILAGPWLPWGSLQPRTCCRQ